jgi:hypothetical protein
MVVARGKQKINGKQEVTSPKKEGGARPEAGSDVTKKGVFVYIYI